jgi:hypothetical protein
VKQTGACWSKEVKAAEMVGGRSFKIAMVIKSLSLCALAQFERGNHDAHTYQAHSTIREFLVLPEAGRAHA